MKKTKKNKKRDAQKKWSGDEVRGVSQRLFRMDSGMCCAEARLVVNI